MYHPFKTHQMNLSKLSQNPILGYLVSGQKDRAIQNHLTEGQKNVLGQLIYQNLRLVQKDITINWNLSAVRNRWTYTPGRGDISQFNLPNTT